MIRIAVALVWAALLTGCLDNPASAPDVGDAGGEDIADTNADMNADFDAADLEADAPADVEPNTDSIDQPDAPGPWSFISTPELLAQAGQEWAYALQVEPTLADVRLAIGPADAGIVDGVLVWTPPTRGVSQMAFTLDAWAGAETVATQSFTVGVNHAPEYLNSSPANATVGQEWLFVPIAEDEDGDVIEWALEGAPDWMAIEGEAIVGTPVAAGDAEFVLLASDGRGGISRLEGSVTIIDVIRDISASTHHIGNLNTEFSLFGCCFDSAPDVYWGGVSLDVDRVNAGRLDIAFLTPPRPGDQAVQILMDDTIVGELPRPLTVLPELSEVDGAGTLFGDLSGAELRLLSWDGTVLESTNVADDATTWSTDARGVVFVEVNGIGSEPFLIEGGTELVVYEITPRIHEPGDSVAFQLSAPTDARLTAQWGDRSTTCFPLDSTSCLATVPGGASGFVALRADSAPLPAVTSALAGGPAGLLHGPWIDWANRRTIPAGVATMVVLSTLGGEPTSPDAEIELVELTEARAVIRVVGDPPVATLRVRSDEWVLTVE